MKATIVIGNVYSDYLGELTRIRLVYPLMDKARAIDMFKREYKEFPSMEIQAVEFDTEKSPDFYKAYVDTGCVRFFKTY